MHAALRPRGAHQCEGTLRASLEDPPDKAQLDWFRSATTIIRRTASVPDQFVQGWPSPFFIVKSTTSDKLPKLNRVDLPEHLKTLTPYNSCTPLGSQISTPVNSPPISAHHVMQSRGINSFPVTLSSTKFIHALVYDPFAATPCPVRQKNYHHTR